MLLSFAPVTARLRARAIGMRTLQDVADETVVLHPAETVEVAPAIALPGEFERVRGVPVTDTFEMQWERSTARKAVHSATVAYRLSNALLGNQTTFCRAFFERTAENRKPFIAGRPEHIAEAQLCTHWIGNKYFGHWLHDCMPLELLAEERGLRALNFVRPKWLHEDGYRDAFKLAYDAVTTAIVEKLWVIDDRGLNAGFAGRFRELRRRNRERHRGGTGRAVFLARGTTGVSRNLSNEAEMIDHLVKKGFDIVYPERLAVEQIAQALSRAPIVVAVEGSHVNHAHFAMPENAALVTIQPPTRFSSFHKVFCDLIRTRFAYVVADPRGDDFSLPTKRLDQTLELLGFA